LSADRRRESIDDLDALLAALPAEIVDAVHALPEKEALIEVVLDLGRRPEARFPGKERDVGWRTATGAFHQGSLALDALLRPDSDVVAYALRVEAYGLLVSLPPVPLNPSNEERSGKATWSTPEPCAAAVALMTKEPEPAGRKYSVVAPAL